MKLGGRPFDAGVGPAPVAFPAVIVCVVGVVRVPLQCGPFDEEFDVLLLIAMIENPSVESEVVGIVAAFLIEGSDPKTLLGFPLNVFIRLRICPIEA